jgi:hypothetical protein
MRDRGKRMGAGLALATAIGCGAAVCASTAAVAGTAGAAAPQVTQVFTGVGHGAHPPQAFMGALAAAHRAAASAGYDPFADCVEGDPDISLDPEFGWTAIVALTCSH